MSVSAVVRFTDPDAYYGAIRNAAVDGVVTARGNFRGELTRIDLHRLWILRGEESLPRICGVAIGNRTAILFASNRDPPQCIDGMELPHDNILIFGSDSFGHMRTAAGCGWGTMSLAPEDLAAAGQAISGREIIAPSDTHFIRPSPQLMSRLSSLHEAAAHLAKTVPDILANPEVARAMEHALVHTMIACVGGGDEVDVGGTFRRHAAIMRRLEEVLEANLNGPLYLEEICKSARVSEKTLRLCCQEQLGMSPKRYLLLRRMHLARRALRMADPATTTVTEIATNYGFWELGRFSVTYRSLFGEAPSASLRRLPDDSRTRRSASSPWQLPDSE